MAKAETNHGGASVANGDLGWIANFIWGIADDILRDLYVRGKYRDVILPMTVLRRLDAVLEPTKKEVLATKAALDKAKITNQDAALRAASGQAVYNTSPFTLRDLKNRGSQQQLRADFGAYLDGFSPNVQEILDNFEFRNQVPRLSKADALGTLIETFLDPALNLSPNPVLNGDGSIKHKGIDNHAIGSIFEELVRRFNEENNEEAGEHWTPRDAVKLMANLIFRPIADQIDSGTYLLYDGALGTVGMLTVAEETLQKLATERGKEVATHLYGQEINAETYAICKADLLLKGEGEAADNIVGGPEISERNGMLKTYDLMARHFAWDKAPKAASDRETSEYLLDRALRSQGIVSLDSICHLDAKRKPAILKLIEARVGCRELVQVELNGAGRLGHWAHPTPHKSQRKSNTKNRFRTIPFASP